MAKRRNRPDKRPLVPMIRKDATLNLAEIQTKNLELCEAIGKAIPPLNGINVGVVFSYELVQHLNANVMGGMMRQ